MKIYQKRKSLETPKQSGDVLQRRASANLDGEFDRRADIVDTFTRSARANFKALGQDAINALVVDPVNVAAGGVQFTVGVVGALKDLGDAGLHSISATDFAGALDKEYRQLQRSGQTPLHNRERAEHLRAAAANIRALKGEDWALVREGLVRMSKGAAFGVYDLASMPVDAAQAIAYLVAAGTIAGGRAIGRAAKALGRAIWRGIQWLGAVTREGAEDVMKGITVGSAKFTNALANGGPRVKLHQLKDHPAGSF